MGADVAQIILRLLPTLCHSNLEADQGQRRTGEVPGEAADLAGGSKKHLLICELNPFDLKINKSKLVRTTEAFLCRALSALALELAAVLSTVTPPGMAPAPAPEDKQAADGVIILPAPNWQCFH